MKAYVRITGLVFALIFVAHAARVAVEGVQVLRQPIFVVTSLLCLGLCAWAGVLLRRARGAER